MVKWACVQPANSESVLREIATMPSAENAAISPEAIEHMRLMLVEHYMEGTIPAALVAVIIPILKDLDSGLRTPNTCMTRTSPTCEADVSHGRGPMSERCTEDILSSVRYSWQKYAE